MPHDWVPITFRPKRIMRAGSTQKDSDPPGDLARVDHEGLQRDAMWRESSPAVTEEDATQFEQVRALARSRMDWFDEQESRWFSPEYSTFRDRGEPQTRLFFLSPLMACISFQGSTTGGVFSPT